MKTASANATPTDESGSVLIISVIVMLMLSTLALAGLARTLSVMNVVRHGQSYDSAHAVADAALHDAMYKLDYGLKPIAGWTEPLTTLEPGKTYQYKVVKVTDDQYRIDVLATHQATSHAVRAVAKRGAGLALFSDDPLVIGSTGGNGVLGVNLTSVLDLGFTGTPDPVHIGSNSEIRVASGAAGTGDFQHTFLSRSGQPARCTGCPHEVRHSRTYPLRDVVAPPFTTAADEARCNALNGTFTGAINGGGGQPFICRRDVKVGHFVLSNGPLVIYVLPTVDADGTETHHSLDISGAPINLNGRAADLRIYKAGPAPVKLNDDVITSTLEPLVCTTQEPVKDLFGNTIGWITVDLGTVCRITGKLYLGDVSFTGLLYAPDTVLKVNADQWWKGAILAKRIEASGTPLVTLSYDQGLQRFALDWAITSYEQIPTTEAVVA
ncbi:MAG TPA: hypothetical protein VM345_16005 [Acidimicrobiales bacterium]|jgi:hypothetical protein|nr:hypothetical protein [Acidimicrobiales bacterium]